MNSALLTNDASVLGLLVIVLALVFFAEKSELPILKKFFTFFPSLLLCYFIPGLLNSFGIISGDHSQLYFVSSRYLLPASLVLLTMNIDLKGIKNLGPKAVIMFLTGTIGIIIGGPIALFICQKLFPAEFGPEIWRGMTTVAGSWIGGGANQAAMKEIFEVNDTIFSMMIAVDVIVANVWMAVLLYLASKSDIIDAKNNADNTSIKMLKKTLEEYSKKHTRIPSTYDLMIILAIGIGATGFAHLCADLIVPLISTHAPGLAKFSLTSGFFWLIVIATTLGIFLSFTKARQYEGAGASKVATVFVYILVASIGMKMDIKLVFARSELFILGAIWMSIHAFLMLFVAKLIKAPLFFMAVGSQANVGGAASAPVVASAFSPQLAPVGVLLAVLGYALGTYGAWICGILMKYISQ